MSLSLKSSSLMNDSSFNLISNLIRCLILTLRIYRILPKKNCFQFNLSAFDMMLVALFANLLHCFQYQQLNLHCVRQKFSKSKFRQFSIPNPPV